MAYAFKNLDFSVQTSKDVIFQTPASKQVVVIGLRVSNSSNQSQTVTVYRFNSGADGEFLVSASNTIIQAGQALNLTDGNRLVLVDGDDLRVQGSENDALNIALDYLELDV